MSGDRGLEVRRRPSRKAAGDGFDAWMVTLPGDLDSYTERFIGEDQEAYTVGSLARAEEALLAHPDDRDVFFGTMRYLGETLLREAGGRWEWEELWEASAPGAGLPFVRVDGPDGYLTGGTVNLLQACSIAGADRSGTVLTELVTAVVQAFGPAGPRRRSSELTTFVDEETWPALEELMTGHREQLDRFVAEHDHQIGPLDGSPESLDRVEQLVVDAYPDRDALFADWESPRVMGAARYVAEVFLAHAPGRLVVRDPRDYGRPPHDNERWPAVQRVFPNGEVGGWNNIVSWLGRAVEMAGMNAERGQPGLHRVLRRGFDRYLAEDG